MENNIEINPVDKERELCSLIEKFNYKYDVHTSNIESEYEYLNEGDICITIPNPKCEYPIYIDLENKGEFTLTYYKWHSHYFGEEDGYKILCQDLIDILTNEKCVIIINSKKRWLYSGLSETKIDENYNYNKDIKNLPKEFQKEIKDLKGNIELFYWNTRNNVLINI